MGKLVYLFEQMSKIDKKNRKATLNLIDDRAGDIFEKIDYRFRQIDIRFDNMEKQLTGIRWMIGLLAALTTALFSAVLFKL